MIHLIEKLKSIGWNERILTDDDFQRCCQREGVLVIDVDSPDMEWPGFYAVRGRTPVIALNSKLRGIERQRVQWHELGHHFLHTPALCFYSDRSVDKYECEAHAVALIALMPEPLLRQMVGWQLEEEHNYTREMVRQRLKVLDVYGV